MNFAERLFERTPQDWAALVLAVLVAIPIHEFAHALAATWAGDPTPERDGRVTLDPLKHLDPLGTILILLGGFGWGKPVRVSPFSFRSPRWGGMWVAAAGPLANIALAMLLGVLGFRLGLLERAGSGYDTVVLHLIYVNLGLAFFNLIPVPPLDGSKVLMGILPSRQAIAVAKLIDQFGPILLILVILTPLTGHLVGTPVNYLAGVFTGLR